MKIEEFKDGYCLTHKGKDYMYSGKSIDVINMISDKVRELLNNDLEELKNKVLRANFLI